MTTIQRRSRSLPVRAMGLVGLTLVVAVASQLAAASRSPLAVAGIPPGGRADTVDRPVVADLDVGDGTTTATPDDTIRINANIGFWSKKLTAHPTDFVAAEQLGERLARDLHFDRREKMIGRVERRVGPLGEFLQGPGKRLRDRHQHPEDS